jgi:hypothetical protein
MGFTRPHRRAIFKHASLAENLTRKQARVVASLAIPREACEVAMSNENINTARPPAQFIYYRFWMLKLRRWGVSYFQAGMIADYLARKCYRAPPHVRARILSAWNDLSKLHESMRFMRQIRTNYGKEV